MYLQLADNSLYWSGLQKTLDSIPDRNQLFHKTFYIAGAAGLIGSCLIDTLLYANRTVDADITVYAVGRNMERLKERFSYAAGSSRLHLIEQDVMEPLKLQPYTDYIIHGASNAYPAAFRRYPAETIMSNVLGTEHLLKFSASQKDSRLLYISSGEVYGEGYADEKGYKEEELGYVDSMCTRSCYPNGKRTAETLCMAYREEFKVDTVVVRPCHTYGPNMTEADNRANAQFIREALSGRDIVMYSRGENIRSYCYVGDCVSALLTVLLKGIAGNAYNIANKHAICTIAQFAEEVARQTGTHVVYKIPDEVEKKEQTGIMHAVLNSEKLEALGWNGKYSVPEGIRHTLKVLKD